MGRLSTRQLGPGVLVAPAPPAVGVASQKGLITSLWDPEIAPTPDSSPYSREAPAPL